MNRSRIVIKAVLVALLTTVMASQVMAAFTLSGTRFIYEEGKKNISFEVKNNMPETYGGQVWINNTTQNKTGVYMVPSPPFFKISGKGKQIVRIMNVNPALPQDRESLFWLNVQELPPKPKTEDGNMLAIAMNTQVKLIYRPKAIIDGRKNAEKRLSLITRDGKIWIDNPTPYYFAIIKVMSHGKEVKLPSSAAQALTEFAPKSAVNTGISGLSAISVEAINDWGGVEKYEIQ